jgi:signal peptidase I
MERGTLKWEIFTWVRDIAIALLAVWIIITFVGQMTNVIGESMMPTLKDGDRVVIDKLSYRFGEPDRFDIVVFPYKKNPSLNYIKRIIGLPGDTVDIQEGKVVVNGERVDAEMGFDLIEDYGDNLPLTVPDGEYFVMGDNRNNSSDSRYSDVGTIKKSDIIGRALWRIWPLSSIGKF